MKKLLLSGLLIASSLVSQAQIGAGTFSLGGGLGIQLGSSSSKVGGTSADGPSRFGFSILPAAQYFVADNFSLGIQFGLDLGSTTSKTTTAAGTIESTTSTTKFSVAPFGRYYYMLDDNLGFFGQAAFSFSSQGGSTKSGGTSVDAPTTTAFGLGISPGLIFFPSKKIGIEAVIGNVFAFQSTSTESTTGTGATAVTTTNSSTTIDLLNFNTLGLGFGFQYYFGR